MAKDQGFTQAPILMIVFADNFGQVDYATLLTNSFEIGAPVQVAQTKAQAKGMGVIVQLSVVDLETIYGKPDSMEDQNVTETDRESGGNPE